MESSLELASRVDAQTEQLDRDEVSLDEQPVEPVSEEPEQSEAPPEVAVGEEAIAPLEVEVGHAFFDKRALHIKVYLKPRTTIPAREVAVGVIGLREGEVLEREIKRVSEVSTSELLVPGQRISLLFSLKEKKLTEYQIQCAWGEDLKQLAGLSPITKEKPAVARLDEAVDTPQVALQEEPEEDLGRGALKIPEVQESKAVDIPVERKVVEQGSVSLEELVLQETETECESPPCDVMYVFEADLKNSGSDTISGVVLGLGLFWANAGAEPVVPDSSAPLSPSEEEVRLDEVALEPGERRKIRVRVDRPIPIIPGGRFVPHLRVVQSQ